VTFQATTSEYFRTMGTRILRGRGLALEARLGAPDVAVVSVSMAAAPWPGQDAIGKCFRVRVQRAPCTTVVGVAQDMVQRDLTGTERVHFYLSIDQYRRTWGNWMILRLRGEAAREAEGVRGALQRPMPGASYVTVQALSDVVQDAQRPWRMGATVFVAFGALALLVAAVGLYSAIDTTSHSERTSLACGSPLAHAAPTSSG
jgi:hypothetical protein